MKSMLSLVLGLLLLPQGLLAGRELSEHELPSIVRLKLDRRFPGWRFALIPDEIREFFRKAMPADAHPDLITGDFDDNGQSDYALLIEHGDVFNEDGAFLGKDSHIVAFLKKDDNYKFYLVDSNSGQYLRLWRKGDKGYSYESDKTFTFARDAIESVIFEKAATSYVYEDGKFRSILTGD